jgi:hypothetical protein
VERWRTRALLGALVLIAAGGAVAVVLAQNDPLPSPAGKGSPPLLMASAQNPLTVAGTGFRSKERVRVVVKGAGTFATKRARADARGAFRVVFRRMNACDSLTMTAAGSQGSRASLNVSSYVCL